MVKGIYITKLSMVLHGRLEFVFIHKISLITELCTQCVQMHGTNGCSQRVGV